MRALISLLLFIPLFIACTADLPANKYSYKVSDRDRINWVEEIIRTRAHNGGELENAERYLKEIPPGSDYHAQAEALRAHVQKLRQKAPVLVSRDRMEKIAARSAAVTELENKLLSLGYDVYFEWAGPNADELTVRATIMSRPIVYKITNETDFLSALRSLGVAKVIFTDNYDFNVTYDLK